MTPPESILKRQVLNNLIQNRIQLQLATRIGIKVNDEILNEKKLARLYCRAAHAVFPIVEEEEKPEEAEPESEEDKQQ